MSECEICNCKLPWIYPEVNNSKYERKCNDCDSNSCIGCGDYITGDFNRGYCDDCHKENVKHKGK